MTPFPKLLEQSSEEEIRETLALYRGVTRMHPTEMNHDDQMFLRGVVFELSEGDRLLIDTYSAYNLSRTKPGEVSTAHADFLSKGPDLEEPFENHHKKAREAFLNDDREIVDKNNE